MKTELKILTIVGARPQFVKAAVLSRALSQHTSVKEVLVHTGQHFDRNMSDVFFDELGLREPDYNLGVNMLPDAVMTGRMLEKIYEVLVNEMPDKVVVFGDTNSTLAGALAARQSGISLAHIEAGLRSHNMLMKEELNRVITDRLSHYLFCPTERAVQNLHEEGYGNQKCRIVKSGDVMYDAVLHYSEVAATKSRIIQQMNLQEGFVLVTLHRAENVDDVDALKEIIAALNVISKEHRLVFPVHPRTRKAIEQMEIKTNFQTVEPVSYFDMLELMKHCGLVMTDSGGLQKEAYFLKKHSVVLRNETEWKELAEHGYSVAAGTSTEGILEAFRGIFGRKSVFSHLLYGNGKAGEHIAHILSNE